MRDYFLEVKQVVDQWGNHNRKYLHAITTHVDALIGRLEARGRIDKVHLWHPAFDVSAEMAIVLEMGTSPREKLDFLGCYFALQFIQMNLRNLDALGLELPLAAAEATGVYRAFMRRIGNEFRNLTANYMKKLLDFYLDGCQVPRYVVCGVGTRADQDDIDVGIIDDGSAGREELNQAIGWMSWEMLRFASSLHFHLSEHVGPLGYSASIAEYQAILDREVTDFVVVAELLGAIPILGSQDLFEEFQGKIIRRYFYHPRGDNRYHEGYLRGILGETKSLLARAIGKNRIHPKDDVLRLVKGIISAKKTMYGTDRVNAWDILDQLKKKDTRRLACYTQLERSLSFVELFRYLYQLFVVQQEEIWLEDANTLESLETVARTMGYKDVGVVSAGSYLLVHYYDHMQRVRETLPRLVEDLRKHLQRKSVFAVMLAGTNHQGNLAVDFLSNLSFFRGVNFWDDLLWGLREREGALLHRFLDDVEVLTPAVRTDLVGKYIDWLAQDLPSSLSFMVLLGEQKAGEKGRQLFWEFNRVFLEKASALPDLVRRIADTFTLYPELVNSYLTLLDPGAQETFLGFLDRRIVEDEVAQVIEKVRNLCQLHHSSSHYFKRFFQRISNRYPESIRELDHPDRLKDMARGALAAIKGLKTFEEKKAKLGEYYDLKFLRVGLMTLQGAPAGETNLEFTNFCDEYLDTLFDLCHLELEQVLGARVDTRDLLAIYATGGHGRGQAYDDDYDLIAILNSPDSGLLDQCGRIVAKMNQEIIRRGTCPHHRLADHFGRYVVRLDELESFLASEQRDTFIDKSQALECRLIVGSLKFHDQFERRVVVPLVFERSGEYVAQMLAELSSRHEVERKSGSLGFDVKEGIGALRDIEMILLVYKARHRLSDPLTERIFNTLTEVDPAHTEDIRILAESFLFLKRLRDVYRLSCAASDILETGYLAQTAEILGFASSRGNTAEQNLLHAFEEKTAEADQAIMRIAADFASSREQLVGGSVSG